MADGRHFELEIKRPGSRPTPAQCTWLIRHNTPATPAFWIDNLMTLERVAVALESGARIEYHGWTDAYDLS
jgi:hypothetical protein